MFIWDEGSYALKNEHEKHKKKHKIFYTLCATPL